VCGRFAFFSPAEAVTAAFGFAAPQVFTPRYNIAPTQTVLTIVGDVEGRPVWKHQHWGLVPFWAKDPAIGNRMINARAETITEKPSYRQAFSRRRCLVPATGFYEWAATASDKKTPYFISDVSEQPLLMAGIWDIWEKGPGEPLHSFTIITREANAFMQALHHRMPVLLSRGDMDRWLAPKAAKNELLEIANTPPAADLQAWPVSRAVNSPLNDVPELVEKA